MRRPLSEGERYRCLLPSSNVSVRLLGACLPPHRSLSHVLRVHDLSFLDLQIQTISPTSRTTMTSVTASFPLLL